MWEERKKEREKGRMDHGRTVGADDAAPRGTAAVARSSWIRKAAVAAELLCHLMYHNERRIV